MIMRIQTVLLSFLCASCVYGDTYELLQSIEPKDSQVHEDTQHHDQGDASESVQFQQDIAHLEHALHIDRDALYKIMDPSLVVSRTYLKDPNVAIRTFQAVYQKLYELSENKSACDVLYNRTARRVFMMYMLYCFYPQSVHHLITWDDNIELGCNLQTGAVAAYVAYAAAMLAWVGVDIASTSFLEQQEQEYVRGMQELEKVLQLYDGQQQQIENDRAFSE